MRPAMGKGEPIVIYGYARVSTDGQTLDAQQTALQMAGAGRVFAEKISAAALGAGDVLLVTRLDRLARSTRDLLNTLAQIGEKGASFKSLSMRGQTPQRRRGGSW
jgi:DNA invertase Pin-like site-specific DNA recombinase